MTNQNEPTRPSKATRATDADDAQTPAGSDEQPTPEEEEAAARAGKPSDDVSRNYEDAMERGAKQQGEGRIP
jgi:hypothetical protein